MSYFKTKQDLELHYNAFKTELDKYKSEPSLVLILLANYLFDLYPELYKLDILHKELDLGILKFPENYSELSDIYAFNKDSYVYTVLNSAHDLILVSEQIRNKGTQPL